MDEPTSVVLLHVCTSNPGLNADLLPLGFPSGQVLLAFNDVDNSRLLHLQGLLRNEA